VAELCKLQLPHSRPVFSALFRRVALPQSRLDRFHLLVQCRTLPGAVLLISGHDCGGKYRQQAEQLSSGHHGHLIRSNNEDGIVSDG
jgi:hypothetical protein